MAYNDGCGCECQRFCLFIKSYLFLGFNFTVLENLFCCSNKFQVLTFTILPQSFQTIVLKLKIYFHTKNSVLIKTMDISICSSSSRIHQQCKTKSHSQYLLVYGLELQLNFFFPLNTPKHNRLDILLYDSQHKSKYTYKRCALNQ